MVHYDQYSAYGMTPHYEALIRGVPPPPPAPPKEPLKERVSWIGLLVLTYIALGVGTAIRSVFPPSFWHEKVEDGNRDVRAV